MERAIINRLYTFSRTQPDRVALSDTSGLQISYGRLWEIASRLSMRLGEFQQDTDFAFVLTNRGILQAVSIVAALMCGHPLAIIDVRQGSARIASMLNQGRRGIGIVDAIGEKLLGQIDVFEDNSAVTYYLRMESSSFEPRSGQIPLGQEAYAHIDSSSPVPKGTGLIIYTSGSTGCPKGVCVSVEDIDARAAVEQSWFELQDNDRILGLLPINFDVGLAQLLGSLFSGSQYIFSYSWFPSDIIQRIRVDRPTGLAMSPMVWKGLLKVKDKQQLWSAFNTLRYVTLSGGTLGISEQTEILQNLTSAQLIKTYGQTEMFRIASLKVGNDIEALKSVGYAYPGVEMFITDDSGRVVSPGQVGNISAKGMGKMIGYVGNAVISTDDPIQTGDLGYIDDSGRLCISGRKGDMVKIMDQRIFPSDVAQSIKEILNVSDAVVIASGGEGPKLDAVLEVEFSAVNDQHKILKLLRQRLASHLVPRRLYFIDKIPTTFNGKVDFTAIREFIREQENNDQVHIPQQ